MSVHKVLVIDVVLTYFNNVNIKQSVRG